MDIVRYQKYLFPIPRSLIPDPPPCRKQKLRRASVGVLLLFFLLFSSCTPKQAAQVPQTQGALTDALGRRYVLKAPPRHIVSLNPSATEILFAIGAGDKVVGVTKYCDYPPEARSRTSVGGFSGATVSVEQIRALEPDLVILSADMHARIVSLLDGLDISSFAVEPRDFSQVYETIAIMGEITGCVPGARKVIADMKEKIARVENQVRSHQRPAVFWILSREPLMSAGGGTFVSEAITLAGGNNIFDDAQEQWPLVSPEQVLLRKPDWVLLGNDMAGSGAPSASGMDASGLLQGSPLLQNLGAVKQGRVAVVNGDFVYRYGPRLADGVVLLAKILHPTP